MSVTEQSYCIDSKWKVWESAVSKETVFCRRLMHFQSLKYLQFWNKSLGKDACPWWSLANMFQRWSETTEFGVMHLVLCDCFFPTIGPKSLLQYVCYKYWIAFGRNWLFRNLCPPWEKKKNLSLLMVGLSSGRKR